MATTSSNGDNGGTGLPEEVIEDLLANDHRRRALAILKAQSEPIIVGDLATAILAAERDIDPENVPESDRKALRDELFTEHLPKLTATDLVAYDSMVGTVELQREETLPDEEF